MTLNCFISECAAATEFLVRGGDVAVFSYIYQKVNKNRCKITNMESKTKKSKLPNESEVKKVSIQ